MHKSNFPDFSKECDQNLLISISIVEIRSFCYQHLLFATRYDFEDHRSGIVFSINFPQVIEVVC